MSSQASTSRVLERKPKDTAFRQQRLPAWHPVITPKPFIVFCLCIGIVFIPIGIALLYASNEVLEVTQQYDNICPVGNQCNITINIPNKMKAPVYMYYRLDDYLQDHRRYVQSRSDDQLIGRPQNSYSDLINCDPIISENGEQHDANKFYFPCGLIAWSLFNDTFKLSQNGTRISLKKNGIAWDSDRTKKFRNPPSGTPGIRVIPDIEDEDFIVWMRTAGLPDWKKLYRIVNVDMEGNYTVAVSSNYPVYPFSRKYIVFSTMSWAGGKNPFTGIAYIVVGIICFVQGLAFAIKEVLCPRPLGDVSYLHWD